MQRRPICLRTISSIVEALWAKRWKNYIIKQQFQAEWLSISLPKPNNTNDHWKYNSQPPDSNKYNATSVCKFMGRNPTSVKITSSHQILLRILQHASLSFFFFFVLGGGGGGGGGGGAIWSNHVMGCMLPCFSHMLSNFVVYQSNHSDTNSAEWIIIGFRDYAM